MLVAFLSRPVDYLFLVFCLCASFMDRVRAGRTCSFSCFCVRPFHVPCPCRPCLSSAAKRRRLHVCFMLSVLCCMNVHMLMSFRNVRSVQAVPVSYPGTCISIFHTPCSCRPFLSLLLSGVVTFLYFACGRFLVFVYCMYGCLLLRFSRPVGYLLPRFLSSSPFSWTVSMQAVPVFLFLFLLTCLALYVHLRLHTRDLLGRVKSCLFLVGDLLLILHVYTQCFIRTPFGLAPPHRRRVAVVNDSSVTCSLMLDFLRTLYIY